MTVEPNFYFDRTPVHDFAALLHLNSRDEFDSPHRSTVPLLALVKAPIISQMLIFGPLGRRSVFDFFDSADTKVRGRFSRASMSNTNSTSE
jgi:hypothetical protein